MQRLLILTALLAGWVRVEAQKIVPVKEEPRHHPVLLNKYVRVINAVIPPGDTSWYHVHAIPSLFVYLTAATGASQILGASPVLIQTKAGQTWYRSFQDSSLTHRIWTTGAVPIHAIDMELLTVDTGIAQPVNHCGDCTVLLETDRAKAQQLLLEPGTRIKDLQCKNPLVVVVVAGKIAVQQNKNTRKRTQGQYQWISPSEKFNIYNSDADQRATVYLYEIKLPVAKKQ